MLSDDSTNKMPSTTPLTWPARPNGAGGSHHQPAPQAVPGDHTGADAPRAAGDAGDLTRHDATSPRPLGAGKRGLSSEALGQQPALGITVRIAFGQGNGQGYTARDVTGATRQPRARP